MRYRRSAGMPIAIWLGVLVAVCCASGCKDSTKPDSVQQLIGTWFNTDTHTAGITHIAIRLEGTDLAVQMWGSCTPEDCDWGELTVPAADARDGTFELEWDPGFKITYQQLVLRGDGKLQVRSHTHFTDDSGRPDYDMFELFSKQ